VEISWHNTKTISYSLDSVLDYINDKTWIITMEKKIIGYKLTKPQYNDSAIRIANLGNRDWEGLIDGRFQETVFNYEENLNLLKEAGVLDLWFEPIYEEEKFKVGDYIYYNYGNVNRTGGVICKIISLENNKVATNIHYNLTSVNELQSGKNSEHIRKATEEEIKKAQIIEIGGYEVKINSIDIEINNVSYSKNDLIVLKHLFKQGQIKSLNVGCSGQYKVDLELLEKIIDKF
jgi:hypothetical protein